MFNFQRGKLIDGPILMFFFGLFYFTGTASGKEIRLSRQHLIINDDHSTNHFELTDGASLIVDKGGKVGGVGDTFFSNKMKNGSSLKIEGGAKITGGIEAENSKIKATGNMHDTADMTGAIDATNSRLDLTWFRLTDSMQKKSEPYPSQVLRLANIDATIRNSVIETLAEDGVGVTSFENQSSQLRISLTHVNAAGTALKAGGENTRVSINNSILTAGKSAILLTPGKADNVEVNVAESVIVSTGKVKTHADRMVQGKVNNAAMQLMSGSAKVLVSDSMLIARGANSAGIVAGQGTSLNLYGSKVSGGSNGIVVAGGPRFNADNKVSSLIIQDSVVTGRDASILVSDAQTSIIKILGGSTLTSSKGTLIQTQGAGSHLVAEITGKETHLYGDLISKDSSRADYNFTEGAALTGQVRGHAVKMLIHDSAYWVLSGPSNIGALVVSDGGTVALSHHTPGNVLVVEGNYAGRNGNLAVHTRLAGDASATDKMVVNGDTSGITNVYVNKSGGSGAKTIKGIELIHVNGQSLGEFKSQGRIIAGLYDYILVKKDKNWYLESGTDGGVSWVRPEAGNYIANVESADSMFLTRLYDRTDADRHRELRSETTSSGNLWLRQSGRARRFHDSSGQLESKGDTLTTQLGGDRTLWRGHGNERWLLGVMLGRGYNHNNSVSGMTGNKSKGSVEGYNTGIYSTWYQDDVHHKRAFVDGQVMLNFFRNRVNGEDIDSQEYKSKATIASVEAGYTFDLSRFGEPNHRLTYYIEPNAQIIWSNIKSDDVRESNGTKIDLHASSRIRSRIGLKGWLQPQNDGNRRNGSVFKSFVEVSWLHNFSPYGVGMNGVSIEQAGADNIAETTVGLEGKITRHVDLWGDMSQQWGREGYLSTSAMAGIKYFF